MVISRGQKVGARSERGGSSRAQQNIIHMFVLYRGYYRNNGWFFNQVAFLFEYASRITKQGLIKKGFFDRSNNAQGLDSIIPFCPFVLKVIYRGCFVRGDLFSRSLAKAPSGFQNQKMAWPSSWRGSRKAGQTVEPKM